MKVLKFLGILILLIVVLALVASLLLPKNMQVEREVTIDAPIDVVWEQVNSWEMISKWSPFMEKDTNMERGVRGEDGTVGAVLFWKSENEEVGEGEQEFTEIDAEGYVIKSDLRFIKPFESKAKTWITLEANEEGQTIAKWGFDTKTPIGMNLMMSLADMKGSIAKDFDKGLASLKEQAEIAKNDVKPAFDIREEQRSAKTYLGKKEKISWDSMESYFTKAMEDLVPLGQEGVISFSSPFASMYWVWDEANKMAELSAVGELAGSEVPDGYETYTLDSGAYLVIDYYGSYDGIGEAHEAMDAYMHDNDYDMAGPVLEEYVTNPNSEPDTSKWLTRVVYPVMHMTKDESSTSEE